MKMSASMTVKIQINSNFQRASIFYIEWYRFFDVTTRVHARVRVRSEGAAAQANGHIRPHTLRGEWRLNKTKRTENEEEPRTCEGGLMSRQQPGSSLTMLQQNTLRFDSKYYTLMLLLATLALALELSISHIMLLQS